MSDNKQDSSAPTPTQVRVGVISNQYITGSCYKLTLDTPSSFSYPLPGQFVNIRIKDALCPLLRRPFSISRTVPGGIQIIYKVVGKGTQLLSAVEKGDRLDVMGPLGKGFCIHREKTKHLLVGGGMGAAPLFFLVQRIKEKEGSSFSPHILIFLGFKEKKQFICQQDFEKLTEENVTLKVATEDGSYGYTGLASNLVEQYLQTLSSFSELSVYACGPRQMLNTVAHLTSSHHIHSQVLLEEIIGCGTGACRGCVVRSKRGYVRVCQEGPVFDAQDILW